MLNSLCRSGIFFRGCGFAWLHERSVLWDTGFALSVTGKSCFFCIKGHVSGLIGEISGSAGLLCRLFTEKLCMHNILLLLLEGDADRTYRVIVSLQWLQLFVLYFCPCVSAVMCFGHIARWTPSMQPFFPGFNLLPFSPFFPSPQIFWCAAPIRTSAVWTSSWHGRSGGFRRFDVCFRVNKGECDVHARKDTQLRKAPHS